MMKVEDKQEHTSSRKYCAWSADDRDLVCRALVTCAKNRIEKAEAPSPLRKKRQVDLDYIAELLTHKTPAQIRDYYYRSLKQIDKLIKERSYEFDTSNADDARAALIYYHKLQGSVYHDLNLTAKDKAQRRTANAYIAERLVTALEQFKADPSKLLSEYDFERIASIPTFDTEEDCSNSETSSVSNIRANNGEERDVPESTFSPKAIKMPLNDEDFIFPQLLSPPSKKQRRYSSSLLDLDDDKPCISPTEKSNTIKIRDSDNNRFSFIDVNPYDDKFDYDKSPLPNNFSRTLWNDDYETCFDDIIPSNNSSNFQDKLNLWVTEHNDDTVVQDMDEFLHSYFD